MSSYLPPIDHPERHQRLHVRRFDPDRDRAPHWESYEVPWVRTMTVMEALEWLWDQGIYVAFRANCREFTCGSCAMVIDGRPALACDTPFGDGTSLEPLGRYPVERDLVVDVNGIREQWNQLELWPHREQSEPIRSVSAAVMESWHKSYARCIECYVCLEACPASGNDEAPFAGPMWVLQMGRARAHPLDGLDRVEQAVGAGIGRCVSCYQCAEACPVGLSPVGEVHAFRRAALWKRISGWFGA